MTVPPTVPPPPGEPAPPPGGVYPDPVPYPAYPNPAPYPPYPPAYPAPYPPYPQPRTNSLAIASLISAFVVAPLGILFGHLSLSQIKRSGEQGRGLAIAGLVIGYVVTIGTILAVVVGVGLLSLAVQASRNAEYTGGNSRVVPSTAERALPPFAPPPGLGSACAYPATSTPPSKTVNPPPAGKVSLEPPVISATMTTNAGPITLQLDNAQTPCTVNSFVSLARQRYFDNTGCHRLSSSAATSMLQCGDPSGSGSGGPGYRFDNEYPTNQYRRLDPTLREQVTYPRGTLAMANAGPDSNGSQFFIVYRDSKLPPTYTVFGRVDEASLAVVDRLVAPGVRGGGDDGEPAKPITITSLAVN